MMPTIRARFWLETTLASLSGSLSLMTIFRRDWLETLTGFDPDRHSGSVEWAIVAGLLALGVSVGVAARAEWLRSSAPVTAGG
jgi:hypothetical protein